MWVWTRRANESVLMLEEGGVEWERAHAQGDV